MKKQSTRHILMIEPATFFANPETMDTNAYQIEKDDLSKEEIFQRALLEFRTYRDTLVENGVYVTTALGHNASPDMVFPNWASTHENGRMVLYPMLSKNRRAERRPAIIDMLKQTYPDVIDLTHHEEEGLYLEARGSLVCDRVNKIAYAALSARTSQEMAEKWADIMDYDLVTFNTMSHTGKPVYHTDLVMYIGTTMVGLCAPAIVADDRDRVLGILNESREVLEFEADQLKTFCGNSLEVLGTDNARMLALSSAAHDSLSVAQKDKMLEHFSKLIHSPLPTLEKYGGGSARCTLMELF